MKEQGYPALRLLSVYRDHGVIEKDSRDDNHNRAGEDLSVYQRVLVGDVVINKMKAWQGSIAVSSLEGIVSPDYQVLRPRSSRLSGRFLHFLLRSAPYISDYARLAYGVRPDQWRLMYEEFRGIPLLVPSFEEQCAVVGFLDRKTAAIDLLLSKKERLIELLQEKRKSLITQAVTKGLGPNAPTRDSGLAWIGEVPAHWSIAPLYARYSVQLGKMLNPAASSGAAQAPYLGNADVQWGTVSVEDLSTMSFAPAERERFRLRRGDLLVCEGGDVGRTAVWREEIPECFYQKALHRLRPRTSKDDPQFFFYVMCASTARGVFEEGGNKTTFTHLTGEKLRCHRFPFPPPDVQAAISALLDRKTAELDTLCQKIRLHLAKLREYRQALITAAVTGKIDVSKEAA